MNEFFEIASPPARAGSGYRRLHDLVVFQDASGDKMADNAVTAGWPE